MAIAPAPTVDGRVSARSLAPGIVAQTIVGSSVPISHTLVNAPLFIAQAVRYGAAAVLLFALATWAGVPIVRPRGRDWLWLAGIAATGLVLFNLAVVRGVAHAEPAAIAVAVACVPIVLGVVGPLLEHRAPRPQVLAAAFVVTAGAVLVEGAGRTDGIGVVWAVVTLACEAAFTLLAVPVLARHGPWGVSFHSVWMGAAMLALISALSEGPAAATRLTAADCAAVAYLTIMVTDVAFILWYSSVASLGAARAGLMTGMAPVSAAVVGILMGTKAPGPLVWLGILVVISGLGAGLWRRSLLAGQRR
jgi:drug/metabolite transporter (DMT)-like permease